jgi:thymidylate synthase ThyX
MTQINAKIVAHSLSKQGDELISVLCTFPRIILAEVNTHRMLSKNTSSSRAIPFKKMVESVQNDPFIPIAWQKAHSGMQGTEYITEENDSWEAKALWLRARNKAVLEATNLNNLGVTKQLTNRLLEPFMWTTMLLTGSKSGWDNFFNLRCPQYEYSAATFRSRKDLAKTTVHAEDFTDLDFLKMNKGQAEIHISALAECIWDSLNESTPRQLESGEWHIPFEDKMSNLDIDKVFKVGSGPMNRQEAKIKISTAMAARTSYTVVGEEKGVDYEKMVGLHDMLLAQDPPHSSPLEHCAQAMTDEQYYGIFGTTIQNTKGWGWCNNFKGFVQYRYMVDNKLIN